MHFLEDNAWSQQRTLSERQVQPYGESLGTTTVLGVDLKSFLPVRKTAFRAVESF